MVSVLTKWQSHSLAKNVQTVLSLFSHTIEEKRSKFIASLLPYATFDTHLAYLKNEHPKAVHFVYAYRYLNEYDQIVENQSDDGEPKNSSGKPTLKVLQGMELINTALIIVRYFGGTKLGVGGLVRAYSDAAVAVCDHAILTPFVKLAHLRYNVPYSKLSHIEYLLTKNSAQFTKTFNAQGALFDISIAESDISKLAHEIEQILIHSL